MNAQEALSEVLAELKPMLDAAGRSIRVLESTDDACRIELVGFCGGCACSDSYKDGLKEILADKAPQIKEVQFIEV